MTYKENMKNRKVSIRTIEKYKLVVDEWFVNGFNGSQAYLKFYPGSSERNATNRFSELVTISDIEDYISDKKEAAERLLRSKHEGMLKEIENWAYSDITQLIGLNAKQLRALPPEVKRLINKYKHTKRNVIGDNGKVVEIIENFDVSLVSKEKAMGMLNRHTGFYEKDNQQKVETEKELSREERDAYISKINTMIYKHIIRESRKLDKSILEKKYTIYEALEVLGITNEKRK